MIFTESENARVRKNIIHHLFSIAALCAVVFTNTIWLTGCVIYDSKDLAKFAKEQLYEKYGEEFEVKTIMDSHRTIAYPVNDPDLLFEVYSLIETRGGKDDYIQSIIGDQYKKIVEKTFADVNLYFYIDVDVPSIPFKEKEIKNTNITIEEYNDEMSAYSIHPTIVLYLSSDFLDCYSNEELYSYIQSIVSDINLDYLRIDFILLEDEKTVEEYYSEYPSLSCNSSLIGFLDEKYERVAQGAEQGIWKMSIDEFNQKMEEIREDELYR